MQKSKNTSQTGTITGRTRGRPRVFDRNEALSQATRLFWLKGYEATTIADLTKAMGIGAPSLYATFGAKEALYAEALRHYGEQYAGLFWNNFLAAATARDAVRSLLFDSATVLTGCRADAPLGCMVTLASVDSENYSELDELTRSNRAVALNYLKARFVSAMESGELPKSTDVHALARYIQALQSGMSILARDGASYAELEAVAQVAMLQWDANATLHQDARA